MKPPADHLMRSARLHLRSELSLVLLVAWLVFVSVPIALDGIGLSWDSLNHHIYLGWVANQPRFTRDYMAASLQSYQVPYLYWPLYKLAISGVSGMTAGIVLASLHLVIVPPLWIAARVLVPEITWTGSAMRVAAVALALMSAVPLKTLESTGNDLLAAAPFIWAVALILQSLSESLRGNATQPSPLVILLSGLLGGLAVALKLSNGPLVILLPLACFGFRTPWTSRLRWMLLHSVAIGIGFTAAYGYWGYLLWREFGNPFYPFYDGLFESVREASRWFK